MSDLNDPRVFFAAERTLLAWTRTGIALMGFGFVIERFGLFLHMFLAIEGKGCFVLGWYLLHFAGYACAIQFSGAVPVRAENAQAD